jgi:hypothetical protein
MGEFIDNLPDPDPQPRTYTGTALINTTDLPKLRVAVIARPNITVTVMTKDSGTAKVNFKWMPPSPAASPDQITSWLGEQGIRFSFFEMTQVVYRDATHTRLRTVEEIRIGN